MGKRLVRAKDKIRQAGIPFCVPEREELTERLDTVLDAIYGAFAEGWATATGTDLAERDLAEEAIFLCRLVVELLPEKPEALGLLALMLHAEARRRARRDERGEHVPLADQNTALWNWKLIGEAEQLLHRANTLGLIGRYQLEGALQSEHVHRCRTGQNNWEDVALRRAHGGSWRTRGGNQSRYFAACFLCKSVQTERALLGLTAESPSSMCWTMPFLSMTMLARWAHW